MTDNAQPTTERDALENDIRELRGANPGEMARRLMERGWSRAESAAKVRTLTDTIAAVPLTNGPMLVIGNGGPLLRDYRDRVLAVLRAALDADAPAETWVDSDPPDERGKYCLDCGQFAPRHFDFCRHALDADAPAEDRR